ncbi:hypothetical protein HMN09_01003500 [Mycena chlorophos]|uniref:Uncharacterized protein n=1 Tax=Mycena chlorophos TaxID=658473 RepID=A0A8H6W1W5_MYCCL|nr:hypothetical protein HMN09_01003500 [Mycena chlorophos]
MSSAGRLDDFPVELLDHIARHAVATTYVQPTLAALVATSRVWHSAAAPRLYHTIHTPQDAKPFGQLIDTLATNTFYAGAVREFHFDEHPRPLDEFAEQISAALTNMQHLTGVYSIWTEQASFIVEATFPSLVECQIPWSYDDTPEFLLRHPHLRKIDMCYEEFGIRYPGKYALPNLVEFQGVDALAPALLSDARNLQRLRLRLDMEFEQDPTPIFRMLARNECPLWLVDITMYRWDERVLSAVPLHGQHITSLVLRNEGDHNDNDLEADRVFMSAIDQIIHLLPNLFFIRIESLTSFNLQDASLQHQLALSRTRRDLAPLHIHPRNLLDAKRGMLDARDPRRIWQIMQAMTRDLGEGEKSALMTLHVLALAELTRPEKYEFVKKMGAPGKPPSTVLLSTCKVAYFSLPHSLQSVRHGFAEYKPGKPPAATLIPWVGVAVKATHVSFLEYFIPDRREAHLPEIRFLAPTSKPRDALGRVFAEYKIRSSTLPDLMQAGLCGDLELSIGFVGGIWRRAIAGGNGAGLGETVSVGFVVCIMPETMLTSTSFSESVPSLYSPLAPSPDCSKAADAFLLSPFLFGPDCEGPTAKAVGTGLGLGGGMRGVWSLWSGWASARN